MEVNRVNSKVYYFFQAYFNLKILIVYIVIILTMENQKNHFYRSAATENRI